MTDQEIDKWVEDHIVAPEGSEIARVAIIWGKIIAHKFYEIGKEEGRKVVDYTAAFEIEKKSRENDLPRYYGD